MEVVPKVDVTKKEAATPVCATERNIDVKLIQGKFFDFLDREKSILITDYSLLDRELVIDANNANIDCERKHKRTVVSSIDMLKRDFGELITAVIQILNEAFSMEIVGFAPSEYLDLESAGEDMTQSMAAHMLTERSPIEPSAHFTITEEEKKLLVEQLVFDILFDKYLEESELMTRNGYSNYMAEKFCVDGCNKIGVAHAINEKLTRGMETYHNRIEYSRLPEQLKMLGVDPNKYARYYIPRMTENSNKKKPKFIWDQLYYNFGLDLTYRQYRRQLTRDNRNYPYEEIFNNLKQYNDFVNKLLPVEYKEDEKYFRMSMDYYVLESYKRVDFILKFIFSIPQKEIMEIDKEYFLIKRFHPMVLVPKVENSELHFTTKHKYYRPLFIIENELCKEMKQETELNTISDYSAYGIRLLKYQIIRAKTYELFKYHGGFISNNYHEIRQFLCQCYDMRSYHLTNTVWNLIQGKAWKDLTEKAKLYAQKIMQNFISINNAFFWKSSDREYSKP